MNIYEIEQSIIAILLIDNDKINTCYLESKHFTHSLHQMIFNIITALFKEKGHVSMVDLISRPEITPHTDYIMNIIDSNVTSSNFESLMALQVENFNKHLFQELNNKLQRKEITFAEAMNEIKSNESVTDDKGSSSKLAPKEVFELITSSNEMLKFSILTNFQSKVNLLKGTMNIIAARTSVGKSAFALNLMNDLSLKTKCLYLNMEMTQKQVYERLVGMNGDVPINQFGKARTDNDLNSKVGNSINKLLARNFKVYDGSKSIQSIRKIVQMNSKDEHCIVFVDYAGYVTTNKKQSDRERVGEVVRELQRMTMDFNITMFLLAQINREGTGEPKSEHLKDSGELEQSGHAILLLHDPEGDVNEMNPIYDIIVDKNRSGRKGKIKIKFIKELQKFKEITYERN